MSCEGRRKKIWLKCANTIQEDTLLPSAYEVNVWKRMTMHAMQHSNFWSMIKNKRWSFLSYTSHFLDPRHMTSFLSYKTLSLPTFISCTSFNLLTLKLTFSSNGQKPIPQADCCNETVPLWSGSSLFLSILHRLLMNFKSWHWFSWCPKYQTLTCVLLLPPYVAVEYDGF